MINVHERDLNLPPQSAADLIERLASDDDLLWPRDRWPQMHFDRPLGVAAVGWHGPIGYALEFYEPGRSIRFRFTRPGGFRGSHWFEIEELSAERVKLRHVIEMQSSGSALVQWLLAVRPLHDALPEDALDRAGLFAAGEVSGRGWSPRVRFLRWAMKRGRGVRAQSGDC